MARPSGRDVRAAALDEATQAIQARGVAGFSYGDLADRIGVKAPSIHHHFPHKDELVSEATARYREAFRRRVAELDDAAPLDRIRRYCELFLEPADDDVLCLCGAVVAGWETLSDVAKREVAAFFADEIRWVELQLRQAQRRGEIAGAVEPADLATSLVSALEGALLLARAGVGRDQAAAVPATVLGLAGAPDALSTPPAEKTETLPGNRGGSPAG